MKQKLHKELQTLLDFYLKQRQDLPPFFTYKAGVINNPSFFTIADLQRHLNNPLLQPEWVHVKLDGDRVELEKSCFYKTVQNRQLSFIDKEILNREISKGAAVVLEGLDILDAEEFAALRRIIVMASLMGAASVLVGLQPGVASALIEAGADVDGLSATSNLDDAFSLLRPDPVVEAEPESEPEAEDEPASESEPDPDLPRGVER